MAHKGAQRIRNVAIVGHRGSGKTSLNEALLFEARRHQQARLRRRRLDRLRLRARRGGARDVDLGRASSSFEYDDRKLNLIDTPGEPSFVADTLAALRVCESAVFVVNGVMGVEVTTDRLWQRADELGLARLVFVNMLDRERADFFRDARLAQGRLRPARRRDRDPDRLRARDARHRRPDRHEGLRVRRRAAAASAKEIPIPDEVSEQAESYREKLMDEVAENSDELMERYLEGEEISHDEIVDALKDGVTKGTIFPVTCGVATKNLGTDRLLDALVNDLPSPARKGAVAARDADGNEVEIEPDESGDPIVYVFKTLADPFAGRINLFRVYSGVLSRRLAASRTCARTARSASASCSCRRARRWGMHPSSAPATSAPSRS